MIVSFFARGTGGGGGSVDYLLGKERDREKAETLWGDADETVALIDVLTRKNTHLGFCRLKKPVSPRNKSGR